jgi:hypothetical protein
VRANPAKPGYRLCIENAAHGTTRVPACYGAAAQRLRQDGSCPTAGPRTHQQVGADETIATRDQPPTADRSTRQPQPSNCDVPQAYDERDMQAFNEARGVTCAKGEQSKQAEPEPNCYSIAKCNVIQPPNVSSKHGWIGQ